MKLDIEKIDRYLQQKKADASDIVWHDPKQEPFQISGLYWFGKEHLYQRFPAKLRRNIRKEVVLLSRCTSGGQLRFRSDSRRLLLAAKTPAAKGSPQMTATASCGFDLYIGEPGQEQFWNASAPHPKNSTEVSELFSVPQKEMREFLLNFPLYNGVQELLIGLEKDAVVQPPSPRLFPNPVVIYGTSITQGGCASRPGMSFTNQLSRRLQVEFLNFGFSGHGKNDPEVAELLAEIEHPALYLIDSEANSISEKLILERVPRFLDILRAKYPLTPIVIITKVKYGPRYAEELPSLKHAFRKVFNMRRNAGDRNIYFIDGSSFWNGDYSENTVDGAHPNDLGFSRMTEKLAPKLYALLKQYAGQ